MLRLNSWWVLGLLVLGPARADPLPETVQVGTLTLTLCRPALAGYCGSIERPLDANHVVPGTIGIGFELYLHRDRSQPAAGTILPQEGGPGYSSTGSRSFYLSLFAALRDSHDVLIVDKRGTGKSGALDCAALQRSDPDLEQAVAACARRLGPSAYLYGTSLAAADVAAVLDALGIGPVDYYGDSYGTFFGQVFAALYPDRLRSIVLDSAYPVRPPDPWFPTDWRTAWNGIDLSCERSVSCRRLGGTAAGRVQALLAELRRSPLTGSAPDANGTATEVTLDAPTLFYTIDYAGDDPIIYRDLDAATRAWQARGDALPLLRLAAEAVTPSFDSPAGFSYGLYTAVICQDYPLLYDLRATADARRAEYLAALERAHAHRPGLSAPFTLEEMLASQTYITPLDTCLPWPAPPPGVTPGVPLPPATHFPPVPTLVLSGDLDSVTSPEDAAETARQFPNAVHIVVPNLTHVVAGGDARGCTAGIVHAFVRTLSPGETTCVALVRPIRTVPEFVRASAELAPLQPLPGNVAGEADLRLAAAALEALGDVIARSYLTSAGAGLRGGHFTVVTQGSAYTYAMSGVRWTEDLAISGSALWNAQAVISAQLRLEQGGQQIGELAVSWDDGRREAMAKVTGTVRGAVVRASRLAP